MAQEVNLHKMVLTNLTFPAPQSLSFCGVLPDEFTESHSTNFEPFDIKSRSNPVASYAGSAARTVSITVGVHEDYLSQFGISDIRDFVAAVKSITYPEYMGTKVVPPRVLLRIGNFFKMKGYCTDCSITWKKPIRNERYIYADITFSITEAINQAFAASEIFAKEDLRRV